MRRWPPRYVRSSRLRPNWSCESMFVASTVGADLQDLVSAHVLPVPVAGDLQELEHAVVRQILIAGGSQLQAGEVEKRGQRGAVEGLGPAVDVVLREELVRDGQRLVAGREIVEVEVAAVLVVARFLEADVAAARDLTGATVDAAGVEAITVAAPVDLDRHGGRVVRGREARGDRGPETVAPRRSLLGDDVDGAAQRLRSEHGDDAPHDLDALHHVDVDQVQVLEAGVAPDGVVELDAVHQDLELLAELPADNGRSRRG